MKFPDIVQSESVTNNLKDGVDYHFTEEELKAIAKFIRQNQDYVPDELSDFRGFVEEKIYSSLSIQEVKRLYSN